MCRATLLLAIAALIATFAPALGQIEAKASCTIGGTKQDDARTGTNGANVICLKKGDDYGTGLDGQDKVRGSANRDTLVGGLGHDIVRGGKGPDRIFVVDGRGGDTAKGGGGYDRCYGDNGDTMKCEERHGETKSYPLATVMALSDALGGSIMFGEEVQIELAQTDSDLAELLAQLAASEAALAATQAELEETQAELAELQALIDSFCSEPPAPPVICDPKEV